MGVARGHRTVQLSEDILLSLEGIVNEHNGAQPDAQPLMEVRRYLAEFNGVVTRCITISGPSLAVAAVPPQRRPDKFYSRRSSSSPVVPVPLGTTSDPCA
jgi:hypothetical protein